MSKAVRDGAYYEFKRFDGYYEVGREIQENIAQMDVRFGRDVYTPGASDAKGLAKKIGPFPPTWHPPHSSLFFPHYHPEGRSFGHVFYGTRGESFER